MSGERRSGRMTAGVLVLALAGCAAVPPPCAPPAEAPVAHVEYEPARWSELPGWRRDDVRKAWTAFLAECRVIGQRPPWIAACRAARRADALSGRAVRAFFERRFRPYRLAVRIGPRVERRGLVTGYFEPVLRGSLTRTARFDTPLYARPPDLLTVDLASVYPQLKGLRVRARLEGHRVVPYYSRADLARDPALKGRAIVWVEGPLGAFFLEVQGSGRVELPDGRVLRLHYADENGYPYRSIGRYLVEQGELTPAEATMAGIRNWARRHPHRVKALLDVDPSVIFFSAEPLEDPAAGPPGALGVPLTPGRSIAVDPRAVPLGSPVYLATTAPGSPVPLQRLVLSEDTGGAIRGAVRADLYFGTGDAAGDEAGDMRQSGRLWLIWPRGAPLPAGEARASPSSGAARHQ